MRFYLCGAERSCITARLQRHFVPLQNKNNYEFRKSYPELPNRTNPHQVQLRGLHDRSRRFAGALPINPCTFESQFPRGIQIPAEGFRRTGPVGHANIFPHEAHEFITKNVQGFFEGFSQM